MIRIYQIILSDEERKMVNEHGHHAVPAQKAKLDVMFGSKGFNAGASWRYYKLAYELHDCQDLNEAFEWTNLWNNPDPDAIEKCHDRATSSSVGDIFEVFGDGLIQDGTYMCEPCGFEKVVA
jgi:hypothetical protein